MSNGVLLLRPHQVVDHGIATEIYDRISILSDEEISAVLLDLSQAQYACAALLRIFVYLANRPDPVPVAVIGASEQFRSLVRLCGADALVTDYFSVEEAQLALKTLSYAESDDPVELIAGREEDNDDDEDPDDRDPITSLMDDDEEDVRRGHPSD